jgi:hypothetical protein
MTNKTRIPNIHMDYIYIYIMYLGYKIILLHGFNSSFVYKLSSCLLFPYILEGGGYMYCRIVEPP